MEKANKLEARQQEAERQAKSHERQAEFALESEEKRIQENWAEKKAEEAEQLQAELAKVVEGYEEEMIPENIRNMLGGISFEDKEHKERPSLSKIIKTGLQQEGNNPFPPEGYDGDFSDYDELEIPESVEAELKTLQQLGRETGYEYAAIVYENGDISKPFTSNYPDKVYVDTASIPLDSTLIHCHTNATCLSSEDLGLLTNKNISAIMNIASNGDVYQVMTNGYHPSADEFEAFETETRKEVDSEMLERARDEGWSYEEYVYMCIKEEMFRICRFFEWTMRGGRL